MDHPIFKKIKVIILMLVILPVFAEAFRFIKFQTMFQEDIYDCAINAIELSMDDEYRKSNISLIDETLCINIFYEILKDKYKLGNSLAPLGSSFIKGQIYINSILVEEGKYYLDSNGRAVTDEFPSMYVKGHFYIRPFIMAPIERIEVPFEVEAVNKRILKGDES